jgi:hypothetical protein
LANVLSAAVADETYHIREVKVEGFPRVSNPLRAPWFLGGDNPLSRNYSDTADPPHRGSPTFQIIDVIRIVLKISVDFGPKFCIWGGIYLVFEAG